MSTTVVSSFGTFTDEELNTLKNGLREYSDVLTMMDSQKEVAKDIINSLYDELKIPKKIIRKMGNVYHKKNFSEVTVENQEFELLYEGIISKTKEN